MRIENYQNQWEQELINLIARFRVDLGKLKGVERIIDLKKAKEELDYYQRKNYPIYIVISDNEKVIGFNVCRIDDGIVWDEASYVIPEERRKRIGSLLCEKAEDLAKKFGNDTVYNWVHPNNDASILMLKKRGYDVLNLIEIRKKLPDEKLTASIKVGNHEFKY
jgi:ribosomal protein S18 acetylase RimI-like enzyme